MSEKIIVDTGPIVALLIPADKHHAWAREVWGQLEPPLLTCEAVLSEAQFLIGRFGGNPLAVLQFIERKILEVPFRVENEIERLLSLQHTYRNLPMSLADACLVRMSEMRETSRIFTVDSHFRVYRRNDRRVIPLLMPVE